MERGKTALIIAVVVIVLIGGYFLFSQKSTTQTQETASADYNIDIINFVYEPVELNIKVGESVMWTNQDSARHTVTSDSGNELDSALLSKGDSYSHTFTEAGTYAYHCTPHPYMQAKIIVIE